MLLQVSVQELYDKRLLFGIIYYIAIAIYSRYEYRRFKQSSNVSPTLAMIPLSLNATYSYQLFD